MSKYDVNELEKLRHFASNRQAEYIDAVIRYGNAKKASKRLGVVDTTIYRSLDSLIKKHENMSAEVPTMLPAIPEWSKVDKVSTYVNQDGKQTAQWIKVSADEEHKRQLIEESIKSLTNEVDRVPPLPQPLEYSDSLLNLYTFTDYHMGMLSWHKETGADWDVKIAEKMLTDVMERMIMSTPNAKVGFINQLGDFLHSDGILPVTPTSGHILDQDGRFSKIVQVTLKVLRRLIDIALTKHEKVVVLLAEGNHDITSSIWLRAAFSALYENEPRVEIIDSEMPFYCYTHGEVMLGFHHGHLKKKDSLPLLFASKYAKEWGGTLYREVHTGHYHNEDIKEHNGVKVVQHPTIAAPDAHSARHGYLSLRQAQAITYHADYGRTGNVIITPEMVQ